MQDNVVTITLLHAILKNQQAITDALSDVADYLALPTQCSGLATASHVRESLRQIQENRTVVGRCITEIMGEGTAEVR